MSDDSRLIRCLAAIINAKDTYTIQDAAREYYKGVPGGGDDNTCATEAAERHDIDREDREVIASARAEREPFSC